MNPNVGKPRKGGRQALGRRPHNPPRQSQFDKSVMSEGVYNNPRLVHSVLTLVGCNVHVQVRNGGIYEGIFKTVSQNSEIVLEMAHKVDTSRQSEVPSKNMLINTLIFSLDNIVHVSATNVELDFANKDTFTDAAISNKYNSGVIEKELQPWDGDSETGLETLEKGGSSTSSSSANGWDAEDMFNTNAEKFKVESSYDPNLSQYTTPLVKKDTKEYRDREARASRLAQEIEKSEEYRGRIALENGDGDDEEMAFSAVHRSGENNNNNTGGKYVPPHLRKPGPGPSRPLRMPPPQQGPQAGSPSPHAQSPGPSPQHPSPNRNQPGPALVAPQQPQRSGHSTSVAPVAVSVSVSSPEPMEDNTENKVKEERRPSGPSDRNKMSERPVQQPHMTSVPGGDQRRFTGNQNQKHKLQELVEFQTQFKLKNNEKDALVDRKPTQPGQQPLSGQQPGQPVLQQQPGLPPQQMPPQQQQMPPSVHQQHTHMPGQAQHKQMIEQTQQMPQQVHHQQQQQMQQLPQQHLQPVHGYPKPETSSPQHPHQHQLPSVTDKSANMEAASTLGDKKEDEGKDEDQDDKDKKSTLNPFAKEFVPSSKFMPRAPVQVPTPPRGATQSPVVQVQPQPAVYPYHLITTPGQPQMIASNQAHRHNQQAKRVVVSANTRPDLTAAQAAAATGQPLLQTPLGGQNPPYPAVQFNVPATMMANAAQGALPQPTGVVQMPGNPRMVAPQQLVQGASAPADQVSFQQNQQHQQHMFVSPQGHHSITTIPSYINGPPPTAGAAGGAPGQQGPPTHPMPTHMAPHHHATPPHTQTNMSSQPGAASGGHPNPSPVPQPGSTSHPHQHPQSHPPPSSGTPQPQLIHYAATGQQANPQHPPLQPSPHTPTSPQTMYPSGVTFSIPMQYTSHQSSYPVQPHMTYSSAQPQLTSVTHVNHQQHQPLPVTVMMAAQHNPHNHHNHYPAPHNQAAINQHLQHNHAAVAAAAAAAASGQSQPPQYQINHAAQHPQAHPGIQGGPSLHGQAGPGLAFVQTQQIVSQAPQPYHHNQ